MNDCPSRGSYKPEDMIVCSKCDNNPKKARTLKGVSSGVRTSLVIDEKGQVTKKILGRC